MGEQRLSQPYGDGGRISYDKAVYEAHWDKEKGFWVGKSQDYPTLAYPADSYSEALDGIKELARAQDEFNKSR